MIKLGKKEKEKKKKIPHPPGAPGLHITQLWEVSTNHVNLLSKSSPKQSSECTVNGASWSCARQEVLGGEDER